MEKSEMSEDFHEWLENCPVQWYRESKEKEGVTYFFFKD